MSPSWAGLSVQTGLKQRKECNKSFGPQDSTQDRTLRNTLTEPLKERKSLRSTSSEKGGCRATRLMKRFKALRRPSMNSLSAGEEYRVTTELVERPLTASFRAPHQRAMEPHLRALSHAWVQEEPRLSMSVRTLGGWVWWHTSVFLALGRLRKEDYSKMEYS